MTSLECRLDPLQFLRVNRSEIVNVAYVQELAPTCHGEYSITTLSGSQVNLTRTYKDALQKILPPDKISTPGLKVNTPKITDWRLWVASVLGWTIFSLLYGALQLLLAPCRRSRDYLFTMPRGYIC